MKYVSFIWREGFIYVPQKDTNAILSNSDGGRSAGHRFHSFRVFYSVAINVVI